MKTIDRFETAAAGDLVTALAARQLSAEELCEAAIGVIETRDGAINALVVRDFDRARTAAKQADDALARGQRGALLGLPMTVKEAINVAGLPTTWGFPPFKDFVPAKDAVSVQRLKAAGAVILGKTNVPPWLGDWQSANAIYGRTNNPWDLTRSPGGSSGGGAAALAAGMTPLELGTDLGGSLRVPAALCGVYAHKPSYGLTPQAGFAPPYVESGVAVPLTVIGPMARNTADLALALDVLAGPDEIEGVGYRLDLPPARHARLADYRVMILDEHPGASLDDEIRSALHALGDRLAAMGATVARGSPLLPDLAAGGDLFRSLVGVITTRGAPPQGEPVAAHALMDLLDAQLGLRRKWTALFAQFDVVLAPAFGSPAFPHQDNPDMDARTVTLNGRTVPYVSLSPWVVPAVVANLPSTAAPIAMTDGGLPIGIQIMGPYLEDRTTLGFAALLEREFGGFRAPPSA